MTAQLKHIWSTYTAKDRADALLLHQKVREGDHMAMRGLMLLWNKYGASYSGEMNMLCPKCVGKTISYFNDIAAYENNQN